MDVLIKIWKDNVWSKVIASIITSIILGAFALVISLSNIAWTIQTVFIILLITFIIILLFIISYFDSKVKRLYSKVKRSYSELKRLYPELRRLYSEVKRLDYYDREYNKIIMHYFYTLNPDKESLDIKVVGEREIKCIKGQIESLDLGFSADECFHEQSLSEKPLLSWKKREFDEDIKINNPHILTKSDIKFKVEFLPPLRVNEVASFKYSFAVSKYRFATKELLREAMKNSVTKTRDFEYNSFAINYPVKYFEHKVEFDKSCKIGYANMEVTRYTNVFEEENTLLREPDKYFKRGVDKDGNYCIHLKRENPPFKCSYKVTWSPPWENDLI